MRLKATLAPLAALLARGPRDTALDRSPVAYLATSSRFVLYRSGDPVPLLACLYDPHLKHSPE